MLVRALARAALFTCGYHRISVVGRRSTSLSAPIVVAAPHSSFLDAVVIFACRDLPTGVSRSENTRLPVFGSKFWNSCGDQPTSSPTDRSMDEWTDRSTDRPTGRPTGRPTDRPTGRPTDCLPINVWNIDSFTDTTDHLIPRDIPSFDSDNKIRSTRLRVEKRPQLTSEHDQGASASFDIQRCLAADRRLSRSHLHKQHLSYLLQARSAYQQLAGL